MNKIIIVGGTGSMGRIIARDLVEFSAVDTDIIVADYDLKSAKIFSETFDSKRVVRAAFLDLNDPHSTQKVLRGASVVINSAPYRFNLAVMEAALVCGVHYLDLGGLFHMTRKQMALHRAFKKRGCLAILGIGAAPGITNILSSYLGESMDRISEIHTRVASADQTKYLYKPALPISYSLQTILDEFSLKPAVFSQGHFRFVEPMTGMTEHRFPKPVGLQKPMYTLHSEVATLPLSFRSKGIREVSFKIAFDPQFVDKVKFLRDLGFNRVDPIHINGMKIKPIEVANKVAMSQPRSRRKGRLKQVEVIRAIVKGTKQGKRLTAIADCFSEGLPRLRVGTDINTGAPPSIVAQMLTQGKIPYSGVLPPELAVPVEPFLKELSRRGMWLKTKQVEGWGFPT